MRIVWTEPAIRDLGSVRAYIAGDNAPAADAQIGRILAAVNNLIILPGSGRPGRWTGTRELVIARTPYLVAYRIKGEDIQILRILHSRQRWPDR